LEKEINILIPDGEIELSLRVLNCLSKFKHIKVHVLSRVKWVEIKFSKNISSFNYFSEDISDKEWIEIIKSEIIKRKIDVLMPIYTKNIRLISKYQKEFNSLVSNLILPSTESFDVANNKWKLYKLLKEYDINSPDTIYYDPVKKGNTKKLEFPVLIKPFEGFAGRYILKINDEKQLLTTLKNRGHTLIQKYIEGYDIDMSVLCRNGKILAFTIQKGYVFRKSPFSPSLGIEFLYDEKIYKIVEKLITKLNWSGVAHIDLKYDKVTKDFKVIEINPRFWGSIIGSNKVGVNFAYLYCLTSLGVDYDIPEYHFENYATNRGLIKILKSKIRGKYSLPKNTSIVDDFFDPLPKVYKYTIKILKKILPQKTKFIEKFKYEIY